MIYFYFVPVDHAQSVLAFAARMPGGDGGGGRGGALLMLVNAKVLVEVKVEVELVEVA